MDLTDPTLLGFVIALGIGLLIGIDRERHKGEGPTRDSAGVRTFTLTALAGAAAGAINSDALMAAVAIGVVGLAALSYWRSAAHDPGLTGEIALVTTALLGMLTMSAPTLAAGAGVVVAVLLYSREGLHHFVRSSLSDDELRDALIFAGATLVVLPLPARRSDRSLRRAQPAQDLDRGRPDHGDQRRGLHRRAPARRALRFAGVGLRLGLCLELGDHRRDGEPREGYAGPVEASRRGRRAVDRGDHRATRRPACRRQPGGAWRTRAPAAALSGLAAVLYGGAFTLWAC